MKKSIKTAITGLLLVPLIALGIATFMPATPSFACTDAEIAAGVQGCDMRGGVDLSLKDNTPTTLFGGGGIITTVINIALYFIGAISVLMLIIGGIRYTLSAGNEKAVTAAKSTIMYAVIGVIIALLAYAIVNFVLGTFNA